MPKILNKEPDRAGQICGEQIRYGYLSDQYCGEPKAPGLFFCREHHEQALVAHGEIRMAPGNAIGR